jgi:hypothetical protein
MTDPTAIGLVTGLLVGAAGVGVHHLAKQAVPDQPVAQVVAGGAAFAAAALLAEYRRKQVIDREIVQGEGAIQQNQVQW